MKPLPWLLVAVPREHRGFRRRALETLRTSPTSVWRCELDDREFVLAETGVGGVMVEQTLDWLRERSTPSFAFMAGFAGALCPDLVVGDGVFCRDVLGPDGVVRTATHGHETDFRIGRLLTVDRLIATAEEKRRLAECGAITVDMETSHLAAWCDRANVPWAGVRVISDDARTPVSKDVFDILEGGRVSAWRLTRAIVRRPTIIRELIHLGRSTGIAMQTIARAFLAALQHPQTEPQDCTQ